jgi:hypothetical protein
MTHSYDSSGSYIIRAVGVEKAGQMNKSSDSVGILVYKEGLNVFAIISNPSRDSTIEGRGNVYFNASGSFVANCTTNETECGSAASLEDSECYDVSGLYCYDLDKAKIGDSYDLKMDWSFDVNHPIFAFNTTGIWSENYTDVVEFNKSFFSAGVHTADLTITYGYYEEVEEPTNGGEE